MTFEELWERVKNTDLLPSMAVQQIGSVDEDSFELTEKTKLRALIGLYAGSVGEYLARFVIYEED